MTVVWPKYRFRRAEKRLEDCRLNFSYAACDEEIEARKRVIKLCKKIVKETEGCDA